MTSPKHLWSGDWEAESAAARRRVPQQRHERSDDAEQAREPSAAPARPAAPPAAPPRAAAPRPAHVPPPQRQPQTPPAERPRTGLAAFAGWALARPMRVAMLAVFVAFAVTAIAIGASSGPGSSTGSGLVASQHAYLGLQVVDWPAGGALVVNVEPGSPAAISGLETGDLLQEVNGRAINAAADVNAAVGSLRPGRQISVQVVRGAFPYTIEVTLAPRPPGALTP